MVTPDTCTDLPRLSLAGMTGINDQKMNKTGNTPPRPSLAGNERTAAIAGEDSIGGIEGMVCADRLGDGPFVCFSGPVKPWGLQPELNQDEILLIITIDQTN